MQGWLYGCKVIKVIYQIKRLKYKNHMMISLDTEMVFDKIQHLFLIKVEEKLGTQRTHLNIIKEMYCKATTNIKSIGKKLRGFPQN